MAWMLLLLLVAFILFHSAYSSETNVTLTTKKGPIIGIRMDPNPLTNVSYDAFIGILYGNVTARFQVAVAPDSWTTAQVTQSDGPACPQTSGMVYSEQCLYLNVYTPKNASGSPGTLPVMAYIHGSAFLYYSSSSKLFGPDFLVPGDVVLVTMNYRLGACGFLTLGSKIAPGNLGLYDTLLALQWIQDEISVFGGDPTRVTLFGESAGAYMTQFHYLSPLSTGLFVRAISESGAALGQWAAFSPAEGARRAKLLATALSCNTTANDSVILACLQAANITDVLANQLITLDEKFTVAGLTIPFMPTLDTNETADTPFLGDSLENLMPKALARAKPMIMGFNTDEGILKFSSYGWQLAEANLQYFIPEEALARNLSDDQKTAAASQIKSQYFSDAPDDDRVEDLVQLYTDTMFGYDSVKMMRYFSNFTYGYLLAYIGTWPQMPSYFSGYKLKGVNHADDVFYLFYVTGSDQSLDTCSSNQANLDIRDKMVNWWTSFSKNGTPGSWQKISEAGYLVIDSDTSYINVTSFESQYYDFWANLSALTSAAPMLQISTVFTLIYLLGLVFTYL